MQFSAAAGETAVFRKTLSGFDPVSRAVLEFAFNAKIPAQSTWTGPIHLACIEIGNRVCLSYIYDGTVAFEQGPYRGYYLHWFLDEAAGVGYSNCRLVDSVGPEFERWSLLRLEMNGTESSLYLNNQQISTCGDASVATAASVEFGATVDGNGALDVAYDNIRATVYR
jgi:hypothetical protein